MLTPSYSEIMEVLNQDSDTENEVITSRYSVVIAAAKRARQIVAGAPCNASRAKTDKAVSIAISELGAGLIKIYPDGLPESEQDAWMTGSEASPLDAQYAAFYGGGSEDWSVGGSEDWSVGAIDPEEDALDDAISAAADEAAVEDEVMSGAADEGAEG